MRDLDLEQRGSMENRSAADVAQEEAELAARAEVLDDVLQQLLDKITSSASLVPSGIRWLCSQMRKYITVRCELVQCLERHSLVRVAKVSRCERGHDCSRYRWLLPPPLCESHDCRADSDDQEQMGHDHQTGGDFALVDRNVVLTL